jgi:hypothetical protein
MYTEKTEWYGWYASTFPRYFLRISAQETVDSILKLPVSIVMNIKFKCKEIVRINRDDYLLASAVIAVFCFDSLSCGLVDCAAVPKKRKLLTWRPGLPFAELAQLSATCSQATSWIIQGLHKDWLSDRQTLSFPSCPIWNISIIRVYHFEIFLHYLIEKICTILASVVQLTILNYVCIFEVFFTLSISQSL